MQVGGLPAAVLLHGLVAASWSQKRSPLCWKGGRLCNIPKGGASHLVRTDQRGIMINDQLSTVSSRLLRPQLLVIEPRLAPSSQSCWNCQEGFSTYCPLCMGTFRDGKRVQAIGKSTVYGCPQPLLFHHPAVCHGALWL